MKYNTSAQLFFIFLAMNLMTTSCTQKLSNSFDDKAFACGAGFDPKKSYIIINDPSQPNHIQHLIALTDEPAQITEKGCLERPKNKRIFVTNVDRSAGIWVEPDSEKNITLQSIGRINLPSACNSTLHSDGKGFTLTFNLDENRSQIELQSLDVELFTLDSKNRVVKWESRLLKSTNYFTFPEKPAILSGEYRLVAEMKDELKGVTSKSECVLRLDDSELMISPAEKIQDRRMYNGQNLMVVQPGYSVNFYVHDGFKDVKIDYCLRRMELADISNAIAPEFLVCDKTQDFFKTQSPTINDGFWIMNFKGQRGSVETSWQHALFVVEKTCTGIFDSVAALRGLGCTIVRGNLNLSDLNDENQSDLDTIGRISGSLEIKATSVRKLNILPNLQETLGSITIDQNPNLTEIRGFNSLGFILDSLRITDNPSLEKIESFLTLKVIAGWLSLERLPSLLDINRFTQLESVEDAINLNELLISDLSFLETLYRAKTINIIGLNNISDLFGLKRLRTIDELSIKSNSNLNTLRGISEIQSIKHLNLENLKSLKSLTGLTHISSLNSLTLDDLASFSSFKTDGSRIKIIDRLKIWGNTDLQNLDSLDFGRTIQTLHIMNTNLPSLIGLESIEQMENLQLENLSRLELLDGLNNLKSTAVLSLAETQVKNFVALGKLELVTKDFEITNNALLEGLDGLTNLREIQGDLTLGASNFSNLYSIPKGLSIQGSFALYENSNLQTLDGLDRVGEIGKDLLIRSHRNLQSLKGVEGLIVRGNAFIGYSDNSFSALEEDFSRPIDIHPLSDIGGIEGFLKLNVPNCLDTKLLEMISSKVGGNITDAESPPPNGQAKTELSNAAACTVL